MVTMIIFAGGHIYRSYANHTSNSGTIPNPAEADVSTTTVDIVVVHLITNRIECFIKCWPLSVYI